MCCTTHWLKCLHERVSFHPHGHPRCAVVRSLTLCSSPCSLPCVSPISSSSTWTLSWTSSSMWSSSGQNTAGTPPNVHSTPHTSLFFRSQRTLLMMCDTTLAQVLVRVIRSMCHAPEWLSVLSLSVSLSLSLSFDPHFVLFRVFLYLPLPLPEPWPPPFPLPCEHHRSKIPCALRQWGVWPFGQ